MFPNPPRRQARALRAQGLSYRAIAGRLGVAHSTVSVWTRDVPRTETPSPRGDPPEPAGVDEGPTRHCLRCRRDLPPTSFSRRGVGHQWWCRGCLREYHVEHRDRERAQVNSLKRARVTTARRFVFSYLAGVTCADCGEADRVVLEFDHTDEKSAHVAELVSRGADLERLAAELDRGEVVCVNCRRRRTASRAGRPLGGLPSGVKYPQRESNSSFERERLAC